MCTGQHTAAGERNLPGEPAAIACDRALTLTLPATIGLKMTLKVSSAKASLTERLPPVQRVHGAASRQLGNPHVGIAAVGHGHPWSKLVQYHVKEDGRCEC